MADLIVNGGKPLSGTITPSGNKNSALPILCATLLTDEPVRLQHVPSITDVEKLVTFFQEQGSRITWDKAAGTMDIDHSSFDARQLEGELPSGMRSSVLLFAPLLQRMKKITMPSNAKGCSLGIRELDPHLEILGKLGAKIRHDGDLKLKLTLAKKFRGARHWPDYMSVTATENFVMAAVLAEGESVLINAASEPHVQDLAHFLVALGSRIDGIGTNTMTIDGGLPLGSATHRIGPDHIEVGSFIGLAAVTRSPLRIVRAGTHHLRATLMGFDRLGIACEIDGDDLVVPADQARHIRTDLGGHIPKLEDQPWPAFPADLMSIAIVTATQCDGVILMFEKMFESRMFFTDKLISMGARIVLCDPHRALVSGPARLRAARVESPDIRAGMAMLLAALCAKGTSTINNAQQIERGYERIDERLNALGARITRVPAR